MPAAVAVQAWYAAARRTTMARGPHASRLQVTVALLVISGLSWRMLIASTEE
jgi:hypothetical protein